MNLEKSLSIEVRYFLIEIEGMHDFTESIVNFINEKHSIPDEIKRDKDKKSKYLKFWGDFSDRIIRKESTRLFEMVLMSLFALFEAFNKTFFTILLSFKPECLKTKEKKLSYEEIIKFTTFEDLHEYIALKETATIGWMNIDDLSGFINTTFKIDIASDFKNWKALRENYYRRNIVVHNGSKISKIYIDKIDGYGLLDLDKKLEVNISYIKKCHDNIWSYIEMIFTSIVKKFKLRVTPKHILDINYPEDLLFEN